MEQEEREFAVRIARKAIENWVKRRKTISPPGNFPGEFKKIRGIFTTLHTYPDPSLRGCIGYPYPVLPLITGIIKSSIEAAQDPRFPELEAGELGTVVIEISVLTEPELVDVKNPEDYLKEIEIGRDGLIIKLDYQSGLLLPQVPVEYGWDVRTFLENLCMKAGLTQDSWKNGKSRIYRFRAEVFGETEPGGKVARTSE